MMGIVIISQLVMFAAIISLDTINSSFAFSPTTCISSSWGTSTWSKRHHGSGGTRKIQTLLSSSIDESNTAPSAVSSSTTSTLPTMVEEGTGPNNNNNNNILILDHLNLNHEKGRHDWVKLFYVDFLRCSIDPRKLKNVKKGSKTIWMNIGSQQFHLPESSSSSSSSSAGSSSSSSMDRSGDAGDAQVVDGRITLIYPDLQLLQERYKTIQPLLSKSQFDMKKQSNITSGAAVKGEEEGEEELQLVVTDPWGNHFQLVQGRNEEIERDPRGTQPGDVSEGWAMSDLTIHIPPNSNLYGIGRFYEQVLASQVLEVKEGEGKGSKDRKDEGWIRIAVGPQQTLTFREHASTTISSHVELRYENEEDEDKNEIDSDTPSTMMTTFPSNYGPHISMYVSDLAATYNRADALGLCYVNPRFTRQAFTLEEAMADCMFRCLDIVDPDNINQGPILQLEHEIRSVVKRDGTKYKSCPFSEIPSECVR